MPTVYLYRFWCNECKDFTLQHTTDSKACTICGTVTESYNVSEIPKEKLLEQRKRYINAKVNNIGKYLFACSADLFSEEWPKPEIIECDAGQKSIDEKRN